MIFVESQEDWEKRQLVGLGSTDPLGGVKNVRSPAVLAAVLEYGGRPAPMWKIINKLAKAKKGMGLRPIFRTERRWDRMAYWRAARELIGVQLLFRQRGWLSTSPIPRTPRPRKARPAAPRSSRVRMPAVGPTAKKPGSKSSQAAKITQSARPRPEAVTAAAGLVAMQPRHRLPKFVGKINGENIRRGSAVRLPNGAVRYIEDMIDGKITVRPPEGSGHAFEHYPVESVVRVKNPAAVILGCLKRGVRERPSVAKAEAARRNGCLPPRPGSRPRGRPRRGAGAGLTPCG